MRTSHWSAAAQVDTNRRTLRYSLAEVAALLATTFLQVRWHTTGDMVWSRPADTF